MNRLVIIGNGFDLAHGLKTSYMDFINWYWDQRVLSFGTTSGTVSKDVLCEIHLRNTKKIPSWNFFSFNNSYFKTIEGNLKYPGKDIIDEMRKDELNYKFVYSPFFDLIVKSIENKGWVDIENAYYSLLKKFISGPDYEKNVKGLNEQLLFLQNKLVEYLGTLDYRDAYNLNYKYKMEERFDKLDFSTCEIKKRKRPDLPFFYFDDMDKRPERMMLLSFNYTPTVSYYADSYCICNYIHGELKIPQSVIFGYGDELDKDYKNIQELNDNELLKNVKSVKYLEASRYKEMLEFIEMEPFQVFIMGHSCGNSDRTLLNTVFEHENCLSIKPFYYKKKDGSDNYMELVQNISRNFTDMKLFRARVVNKEQCEPM